ncbi:MAG TPA: hypothetical protein DEQ09_07585 [Bacteroidales bacterium]|nr:hypothetical protein [Bacteroidales bacterium]
MTDYSVLIPLSARKPVIQFLVSMLVILVISIAGLIITLLTAWLIFDIAPGETDISQLNFSINQVNYLKFLQAFQHISMFLVPSLVIAYLMKGDTTSFLKLKQKPGLASALLSIIFIALIIPLNSYLAWLNEGLDLPAWLGGLEQWISMKESQAERLTHLLIDTPGFGVLVINIFVIAVIPALGEEFLYRGVLQNIFNKWFKSGSLAVLITAIIFSATHMQFYGFLPRFILGLGFGFIYLWSRNIWLPVLAHLTNNIIPVILSYFIGWENINSTADDFSSGDGLISIIPAIIAVLILVSIQRISLREN